MTWTWLATGSASLLGLYEINKKLAVRANPVLPVLVLSSVASWCTLLVLINSKWLAPAWAAQLQVALQPLSARAHGYVFLKAVIVSSSWVLSFVALQQLPLSVAAPLRSCSPVITVLGAVALYSEAPRASQWLGLVLVLAGAVSFALLGNRENRGRATRRALGLLLGGMILTASSGLFDKFLLQSLRLPPTSLQFWFTSYNLLVQSLLAFFLWWPRRKHLPPLRLTPSIVAVGFLLTIADQFYFRAVAEPDALVSVVSLIRRCSVLISFAAGGWLFKERWMLRKSLPLSGTLAGLWILLTQ